MMVRIDDRYREVVRRRQPVEDIHFPHTHLTAAMKPMPRDDVNECGSPVGLL
jgi:hypothetical protein